MNHYTNLLKNERFLFVCSANLMRSPTAEYVARASGYYADSCGTDHTYACKVVTYEKLAWATVVVAMQQENSTILVNKYGEHPDRIYVWNLDDIYDYMQPALINICKIKLENTIIAVARKRAGK